MVVRRQYADKGVGIQKRPPPPPKINVDNLIVDDKVRSSGKKTSTKKKAGKKSKASAPLIGVPRCEPPRDVLQSREPESSHRRSSGRGDRRHQQRDSGRTRTQGYSPTSPRQKSLPRPPPPKEYAIAPTATKRTKSLAKTSKPSTNSKAKLFGARKEAKKKAAAPTAATRSRPSKAAKTPASPVSPKWNQVLYGQKSPCNKSLASSKCTKQKKPPVIMAQMKTGRARMEKKKVVRIRDPPGSVRSSNTRSIKKKAGLDDKIIMALDKCLGDFDLYDFLGETGEQVDSVQQYLKEADETTMPGKAKLLYHQSTETYQESKKQVGDRFERSVKAMADADQGLRPEPEPEPEEEIEDETPDDNEDVPKERSMDFAVEVTTDTAHNDKSLDALLKKPQPQEVSAAGSTNEKDAEATNKVDLSPIKKQIKNEVKEAKKSASKRLGLYLQGLATDLMGEDVENVCCSAIDTTTLDEEDNTKSVIEKEMEERKKRAVIVPSVPDVQQQQIDAAQASVPASKGDDAAGNDDNEAAIEAGPKDIATNFFEDGGIAQPVTPNTDADNTEKCSEKSTDGQSKDSSHLYGPFQSTFPIDQKVSDLLGSKATEEEDSDEEVIETSTQKIEDKVKELFQMLEERKVQKAVDVVAILDSNYEVSANTEEKEKEGASAGKEEGGITSKTEEKEEGNEMDKTDQNDSHPL
mmetsp:Transcript_12377/g.35402  ORF Transcript_12377/g.35402 Transcript_12377/m.35402 type:complete len:693 (-) Transcript_12377:89-2167(-)|eukprot:CAMPEP_0181040188 /NCGR_PEP_ID=MMETSP1070-20121207/10910_1 /TAXON_ID=265543 /ORGANISM="Minutocellus polymorphus, Strain NH13" /LENGTH=692 /DNA_ID=CAMNT_0023118171 /DNA_START=176 /DNA_END=2254 /DNA_ORIENTATION=-